jgi:octaprenyl-diphosphate synthase
MPNLTSSTNPLPSILLLVSDDMQAVDKVISERLASGVALVGDVAKYIISAGGKRLRPALHLLMCGALGYSNARRFELAAVIEFIHTATLLHDDVVDGSALRRGNATANEMFGNPASVLVGDFLYSRAFQMMVGLENMHVMRLLSDATNVIAEGEVMQLMNIRDASLTETSYLQVIQSKTAKLFEASAHLAAVLAGASDTTQQSCACYGRALGTAFQLVDDVLDYDGNTAEMGKNLGDDLREGKVTLPLIVALQRGTSAQNRIVREAIETGNLSQLDEIVGIVRQTGGLEVARQCAAEQAQTAIESIEGLSDSAYKQGLLLLAGSLLHRTH